MITPKQVLIDTNVLVALVDTHDIWHARAHALREALKTTATSLIYCDVVLNEAISVFARRAQEQRRVDQFAGLVNALLHEVPTNIIIWLSSIFHHHPLRAFASLGFADTGPLSFAGAQLPSACAWDPHLR